MSEDIPAQGEQRLKALKDLTQVVYLLYALSYFTGITAIVGIMIDYIKREDVANTWLESHFRWQIRTFWFGLLWAVIGIVTLVFIVGYFILFANFCWVIYRIVKGWLYLHDGKPMPL
jgi:uncharacterized membrane protein